ncbi:hypothetical protein MRX96_048799 [Rhipicephalus microplus]
MKLDATVNMYHHFCDFLNLYLSMHFNNTLAGDFDILIWDMVPYRGTFLPMRSAFHSGKLRSLSEFQEKKVCLARHTVCLPAPHDFRPVLQLAFGARLPFKTTRHRRILNEDELLAAARKLPGLSMRRVHFSHATEFRHPIEVMANTDVLIGMHGAGLTHVLFQPDWAVLFEIYNCHDPVCYKDLARLRGVKYFTWEDSTKLQAEDEVLALLLGECPTVCTVFPGLARDDDVTSSGWPNEGWFSSPMEDRCWMEETTPPFIIASTWNRRRVTDCTDPLPLEGQPDPSVWSAVEETFGSQQFSDYVTVDDDLVSSEQLTDEGIVARIRSVPNAD